MIYVNTIIILVTNDFSEYVLIDIADDNALMVTTNICYNWKLRVRGCELKSTDIKSV